MKVKTINNLNIRPLRMEDIKFVLVWSRDDAFCLANEWEVNRDEQELVRWWKRCVNNASDDFIRMGIEYENRLIGYTDLACIKDNTAELGIAIGETALWGNGFGMYSCVRMMEYATTYFGISVFNAETHVTNIRARKMLKKLGFKEVSSEDYPGAENERIQYRLSL